MILVLMSAPALMLMEPPLLLLLLLLPLVLLESIVPRAVILPPACRLISPPWVAIASTVILPAASNITGPPGVEITPAAMSLRNAPGSATKKVPSALILGGMLAELAKEERPERRIKEGELVRIAASGSAELMAVSAPVIVILRLAIAPAASILRDTPV